MNEQTQTVLNTLAEVWDAEANATVKDCHESVPEHIKGFEAGTRQTKRECADALRMLIQLFTPREL